MNAKLSCSFLLPFVFTSMAERAALFFFSRSELLSTSYCIRPGTDCFPLVFLVSEGRARLINTTMPCEGARRSGRTIRAVVAVRPTRNNHGRSGPLPTSRASRTTTTVGKEVTPPIPDTNRVRNNRNDRPPPRVSGSLLCTPPLIVSAWKARPVSWDGAGGGGEQKQHQHRPFVFRALIFCWGRYGAEHPRPDLLSSRSRLRTCSRSDGSSRTTGK